MKYYVKISSDFVEKNKDKDFDRRKIKFEKHGVKDYVEVCELNKFVDVFEKETIKIVTL